MFIFKQPNKCYRQHQRVAGENQPYALPVGNTVYGVHLHHFPARHAAENAAEAVGHHQEHTLRAGANFRADFFLNEYRTGDVEEVEGAAVNNHRQYQQYGAERRRVAVGEQAEAQHPREDTNQHHVLDTVTA